jgi:hypothetical protein
VGAWSNNPVNLNTNFLALSLRSQAYLRVTMTIQGSTDSLSTPNLSDWRVVYDCVDSE